MSANRVLLTLPKGRGKELRVTLSDFKGTTYVDVRTWYETPDGTETKPTREGVSIRPDILPDVLKALQAAQKQLAG